MIQLFDIGTVFRVTIVDSAGVVVDISSATTKEIVFMKSGGTVVRHAAVFTKDGTDGTMEYTAVSNDLDTAGKWKIQGRVVLQTGDWSSTIDSFYVVKNL